MCKSIIRLITLAAVLLGSSLSAQDGPNAEPWQADPRIVEQMSKRDKDRYVYRESEVAAYELPAVLGDIKLPLKPEAWKRRRADVLELFRQHVYGRRPNFEQIDGFRVTYHVESTVPVDPTGGKAIGQKVICSIHIGDNAQSFPFYLYRPVETKADALPLIILINNRAFPDPAEMAEQPYDFWPLDLIVQAGFATAVFHTSDVDPDRHDGYLQGIRGFLANGRPRETDSWGALSAWGWAASRVLDYAQANFEIDPERVAVVGHSRGGKTALWAAAEDPRFTIAYSNESGCGGAALSRRRYGETVGRITSVFPHWFCEKFVTYADREHDLPVDQHQLIALIAPRAVYVASAAEDLWADPRGEYLSVVGAAPAYKLLGHDSISDPTMPALGVQRIVGQTGYHIRPGQHNLTRTDWSHFISFVQSLD